jgi:flagellar basal-body rod protein FlgB
MADSLFTDTSMRAAKVALDGLTLRQQAISRNLANIDTPGYKAKTVDFESTLKQMLNPSPETRLPLLLTHAGHQSSTPTQKVGFTLSQRPGGTSRADENNVDVDVEMTDQSEAGIQYQAVTQVVSKKLQLLRTLAR